MEYTPHDPESDIDDDDSSESGKKKKKSAGALGAVAVEPKKPEASPPPEEKPAKTEKAEKADDKLAELSSEEKLQVEQRLVEAAAAEQPANAEQLEADEAQAEAYVARFRDKIINEAKPSDEAYEETLDEIAEGEESDSESDEGVDETHEFEDEGTILGGETADEDEEDDDFTTAASSGPAGASGAGAGGSGGSGTSGGGTGSGGSAGGTGGGGAAGGAGGTGGGGPGGGAWGGGGYPYPPAPVYGGPVAPGTTAPNPSTPGTRVEYIDRYHAGNAIVGLVVGYLIGRRRGRIKTEKRLLPVQQKLEKQVENMQFELAAKEEAIRAAARERLRIKTVAERISAPEAKQLHGPAVKPERIGHVLMQAEAPVAEKAKAVKAAEVVGRLQEKEINSLSRQELMAVAEKIQFEGSNLRHVYESNLIGERGLRRLVQEYLRGGDLQRALRRELVEREIDFNRDPLLRDRSHTEGGGVQGGGTTSLNDLLKKAGALPVENQLIMLKEAVQQEAEELHKSKQQRRLLDAAMAGTIAVLLGLVLYLMLHSM